MSNNKRAFIVLLVGIGLTLILAGLTPILVAQDTSDPEAEDAAAQDAEAADEDSESESAAVEETEAPAKATSEASPQVTDVLDATEEPLAIYDVTGEPVEVTGDNSYCMVCHNQPWHTVTLPDGSILNLYVNPQTIAASVHGVNSSIGQLGCIDCHGADSFPHNKPSPVDDRAYTLDSVSICANCHLPQVEELESGLHEQAILRGNHEAAVCTDCHGAHDIQPVVEEPQLIAGVCGDCHTTTLAEWQASAHVEIGPLGCATCHSQHTQRIRAGNSPNELCINCHNDPPESWVHTQHASADIPVECVDCHMYTEASDGAVPVVFSPGETPTGHTMLLDSRPCNTCHEQLLVSGEWFRIGGDSEVLQLERNALQQRVNELEAQAGEQPEASQPSFTQLLQGLILGLGFGITAAAIFIARGNRQLTPASTSEEHSE